MRFIGIDYGSKRTGIAISDEAGQFAMPYSTLETEGQTGGSKRLIKEIVEIIKEKKVEKVVIGESKNSAGQENDIMKDIRKFAEALEKELQAAGCVVEIIFEPEFLTSDAAAKLQYDITGGGDNKNLDASAAAMILQRYLDRNFNNNFSK